MVTIASYKILTDLHINQKEFPLPNFLKDLLKENDVTNFEKLEDFFESDLQQTALQNQQTLDYFFFLSEAALLNYLLRRKAQAFSSTLSLVQHRMTAIRNIEETQNTTEQWDQYFSFISVVFDRLARFIPIEKFESYIDKIEWNTLSKEFIPKISSLLGMTYLMEDHPEQINKSRLWLYKASGETQFPSNLINQLWMAEYYRKVPSESQEQKLAEIAASLGEKIEEESSPGIAALYQSAICEIEAVRTELLITSHIQENLPAAEIDATITSFKDAAKEVDTTSILTVVNAFQELVLGRIYAEMASSPLLEESREENLTFMTHHLQSAQDQVAPLKDTQLYTFFRRESLACKVDGSQSIPEKDFKELLAQNKKNNNYIEYGKSVHDYVRMLSKNGAGGKILDILLDSFKLGRKKIEEGGFYLIVKSLEIANDTLLVEIKKPGVSWMVGSLDKFFNEIIEIIEGLKEQLDLIGEANISNFRKEYLRFEPLSHHHILVYFRYQLYALKLLNLGAYLSGDALSQRIGDQLVKALEDSNNPLSFIDASWDEFKDIPNMVRNSTLNKCINITKGDLPKAAEHLNFSYRNLRSYITFKEVNRLGLFLNLQETDNKQLEMGIRYMFYDLYKKGTIFEVVFDMPIFLVKYAQSGFFSQDLEEELNIKGTTAKKYIKIMMEIGLITQDKNAGRKHFYRLSRETVMKRLGREQELRVS
ncbi:MAG: helix-turn-helix domain-containing protein [Bacteroidota bacterium]